MSDETVLMEELMQESLPADVLSHRRYLTKQELMELIPVSLSTINRLLKSGTLPFIKIGRRVLIPVSAVENLHGICEIATVADA